MYLFVARQHFIQVFHLIYILFNFNYWKLFLIVLFLLTTLLVSHTQSFYFIILFCIVLLKCTLSKVTEASTEWPGILGYVDKCGHHSMARTSILEDLQQNYIWLYITSCDDTMTIPLIAFPYSHQHDLKHSRMPPNTPSSAL